METSNAKVGLYKKLLEIQKRVKGVGKDSKSFGYSYTSGSKILGEIKPLMNDLGLLLKQEVTGIYNERQDYKTAKGAEKSEILTKVELKFTWVDVETGQVDENLFAANGQNDFEKGLGSALTYAERYFLLKYFHISTDEDDIDNPDRKPEENSKATPPAPKDESPAKKPDLPLLTLDHPKANAAIKAVNNGTYKLSQILAKYDISDKVLAKIDKDKK